MNPDEILREINEQFNDLRNNINSLEESLNRHDFENPSINNEPFDVEVTGLGFSSQ
jgi:hypothetical protein